MGIKIFPVPCGLFVLFFFRNQTTFILFTMLIGLLIMRSYKLSGKYAVALIVLILLVGPIFQYFERGYSGVGYYRNFLYTLHLREATGGEKALGGHIAWDEIDSSSLSRKAMGIRTQQKWSRVPLAAVYSIITPFPPWLLVQRMGSYGLFYAPGMVMWLYLLPFLFIGISYSLRSVQVESLLLYGMVLTTYLGIAILFEGVAWRYRLQVAPLALILASIGYQERHKSRLVVIFYWIGLCCVTLLYTVLKS